MGKCEDEMNKALTALYLEAPESVCKDVERICRAAVAEAYNSGKTDQKHNDRTEIMAALERA